ncbi:hypothetical protein HDV64DRAFT_285750 [Trichoderma sp. TUCIM 5745]
MAGKGLILLTGATGFVSFRVLTTALKAGYNVRIAVRSLNKANNVINFSLIKALNPSEESLSSIVIEDMAAPGVFDEAVKGATYVIYCATPIPLLGREPTTPDKFDEYSVQASRKSVIGLLEAPRKPAQFVELSSLALMSAKFLVLILGVKETKRVLTLRTVFLSIQVYMLISLR